MGLHRLWAWCSLTVWGALQLRGRPLCRPGGTSVTCPAPTQAWEGTGLALGSCTGPRQEACVALRPLCTGLGWYIRLLCRRGVGTLAPYGPCGLLAPAQAVRPTPTGTRQEAERQAGQVWEACTFLAPWAPGVVPTGSGRACSHLYSADIGMSCSVSGQCQRLGHSSEQATCTLAFWKVQTV